MNKRILLTIVLSAIVLLVRADDLATSLMLMNDYATRQNQDLWARMRSGFKLDHSQSDRVEYFEKMYTKSPQAFNRMMNNARPFLYYMLNQTERNGLPSELALIPGVESTFDPLAHNPGDAYAGMWQFVPTTGRRFNMQQNDQLDERRDIIKSTQAALNYLNYLHSMFGQWDVAIGAYNWGEGNMYRAVLNSGQPLGHVVYADLELRQITSDYVAKVIAIASVIENPDKFGVTLDSSVEDQPYFAVVNPSQPIALNDLLKRSGSDKNMFAKLNGQYKDSSYLLQPGNDVLLPLPNQITYYASLGIANPTTIQIITADTQLQAPAATQEQTTYTDADDKLDDLINSLDTGDTSAGKAAAEVTNTTATKAQQIMVAAPAPGVAVSSQPQPAGNARGTAVSSASSAITYTVAIGDTLYSIARRFKADVNEIKQQNHIAGNNLIVGQTLIIKPGAAQS